MPHSRRRFLNAIFALLLPWLPSRGWTQKPDPKPEGINKLAMAIAHETGGIKPSDSELLKLDAPDIAEDGAIVPITLSSELSNIGTLWVFVEKNPTPLAARFDLDESLDTFVSLRIKMNESCEVVALAKSGDEYFMSRKPVRVVLGGCG